MKRFWITIAIGPAIRRMLLSNHFFVARWIKVPNPNPKDRNQREAITQGEIFTLENKNGGGPVQFEWAGKRLKIRYPAEEGVSRAQSTWNNVDIVCVF